MSSTLKDKLIADLGPDVLDMELVPVDSSNGAPKVYQIEIAGKMFYDWVMTPPNPPDVKLAPAESWKTPLNFETHEKFFGPGMGQEGGEAKEEMYKSLKQAISDAKGGAKAAEPKAAEPKAAEPKAAEPKAAEPKAAEAKTEEAKPTGDAVKVKLSHCSS